MKIKKLKEANYGPYKYRYEVHYSTNEKPDILFGASKTVEGANNIALNCAKNIFSNPWESNEKKYDIIDSIYAIDTETEKDVMSSDTEDYLDELMSELLSKIRNNSLIKNEALENPKTEVWNPSKLISLIDSLIYDIENLHEDVNEKYNLRVSKIVASAAFERSLKKLKKDHKSNSLRKLKKTLIKLGNFEIESEQDNHPLKGNLKDYLDIHIEPNLVLIYKYADDILIISLEVQDIVNHDKLDNYNSDRLNNNKKEISLDDIYNK